MRLEKKFQIISLLIFIVLTFVPYWPYLRCADFECTSGNGMFWSGLGSFANSEFFVNSHAFSLMGRDFCDLLGGD